MPGVECARALASGTPTESWPRRSGAPVAPAIILTHAINRPKSQRGKSRRVGAIESLDAECHSKASDTLADRITDLLQCA